MYKDVGISAFELYFPQRYVAQTSFEIDPSTKGKFVIGLGQERMVFTGIKIFFCGLSYFIFR
jgi:hydroxymethylglutaryl-CoA synthase